MENCRNWKLVTSKLRNRGDSPNVGEEPLEHEEKLPNASGLCDPEMSKIPLLKKLLRRHWTLVWPVNDRPVILNPFRVRNTGLSLVWPAYYRPSVILPKKEKNHRDMRGLLPKASGSWDPEMAKKPLHEETAVKDCILAWAEHDRSVVLNPFGVRNTGPSLYDQHTTDPRWFSQRRRRITGTQGATPNASGSWWSGEGKETSSWRNCCEEL